MGILDLFLGGGFSVLLGGITGLAGTAITTWGDYKKRQQDLEAKKVDNEFNLKAMDKEWAGRTQVARTEGETAIGVEDGKAFTASLTSQPQRYLDIDAKDMNPVIKFLLGLVDFWRGLIRPGMTTYLVVLVTLIYLRLEVAIKAAGIAMTGEQAFGLQQMIINTILYLASTTILWWFGTRNKQKPPKSS